MIRWSIKNFKQFLMLHFLVGKETIDLLIRQTKHSRVRVVQIPLQQYSVTSLQYAFCWGKHFGTILPCSISFTLDSFLVYYVWAVRCLPNGLPGRQTWLSALNSERPVEWRIDQVCQCLRFNETDGCSTNIICLLK